MLKVSNVTVYGNKGTSAFDFELVPDVDTDEANYKAGVELEDSHLEEGSFAEKIYSQLVPSEDHSLDSKPTDCTNDVDEEER